MSRSARVVRWKRPPPELRHPRPVQPADTVECGRTMSQEEVEAKISGLLELHAKWTALDGGSGSSGLRSELQASLKALELDLEDLEDALSIAKGDRTQEKESVEQREAYIATARSQLASVAASVAGPERNSNTVTEPAGGTATPSATQAAAPQTPATSAPPAQPADDPVPRCQVPNCSVM